MKNLCGWICTGRFMDTFDEGDLSSFHHHGDGRRAQALSRVTPVVKRGRGTGSSGQAGARGGA
jgi:hypothetical protein